MKIGRNDPCPCGSGRKYKHCCLAAAQQETQSPLYLSHMRLRRKIDDLPTRIMRFVEDTYGIEDFAAAFARFIAPEPRLIGYQGDYLPLAGPWMMHRWIPAREDVELADESLYGRPPTQVFLERRGHQLAADARRYVEAAMQSPFSFYQVEACRPGIGLTLRDLFTDERREVQEREISRTADVGEILFAQLVGIDELCLFEACSTVPLPVGCEFLVSELRETILAEHAISPADIPHQHGEAIRRLHASINALSLLEDDADAVAGRRVRFEIDSTQAAFDALAPLDPDLSREDLLAGAERDEDGRVLAADLYWSDPDTMDGSVGHCIIRIDRLHLTADAFSEGSAVRVRETVKRLLGDQARYLGTESFLAENGDEETEEISEDVRAILEFMSGNIEAFLHQPLPALGGKTPLESADDAQDRERLSAFLRTLEQAMTEGELLTEPGLFTTMRTRLRLDADC